MHHPCQSQKKAYVYELSRKLVRRVPYQYVYFRSNGTLTTLSTSYAILSADHQGTRPLCDRTWISAVISGGSFLWLYSLDFVGRGALLRLNCGIRQRHRFVEGAMAKRTKRQRPSMARRIMLCAWMSCPCLEWCGGPSAVAAFVAPASGLQRLHSCSSKGGLESKDSSSSGSGLTTANR